MDDQTFLKYKKIFFGWAVKNWTGLDDNTIEEVFFDALSVYLDYQQKGKVSVQPTTFIISVAHRLFSLRQKKQTLELKIDLPVEVSEQPQRKELMRKALTKVDEKCRRLLILRYFNNMSMEEIMLETGAKSREVLFRLTFQDSIPR